MGKPSVAQVLRRHSRKRAKERAKAKVGSSPSPGDWTCPNCGFNVFAGKDSCFKCGTQKPAAQGSAVQVAVAKGTAALHAGRPTQPRMPPPAPAQPPLPLARPVLQ